MSIFGKQNGTRTMRYRRGNTAQIKASLLVCERGFPVLDTETWEIRIGDGERIASELPVIGILPEYFRSDYK